MKYEKAPLPVDAQIDRLVSRGLLVEDRARAEASLLAISYYRLSGYFVPFERRRGEVHEFRPGTRFEDIVDLYTFDHKLRILVFDALERIETAFRTQLIYRLSLAHGGWWFENEALFYNPESRAHFLEELDREVNRSKEIFIRHYHERYGNPPRPPAWISFEVVSLGQLSKLFRNLRPSDAKKQVAAYFGVGAPVLESWLECLTNIRNTCAHHARLWNKTLVTRPKMPKLPAFPIPSRAAHPGPRTESTRCS
jgi:abortive infection bacteriophage resistance protein